MRTPFGAFIIVVIMLLLDNYVFLAIKTISHSASPKTRSIIFSVYWTISIIAVSAAYNCIHCIVFNCCIKAPRIQMLEIGGLIKRF